MTDPGDYSEVAGTDTPKSAASKLFDLRRLIGGLFTLYGVLLLIHSFFDTQADLDKAAGVHINLWLGIGMLLVGIFFLVWGRLDPVRPPDPDERTDTRPPAHH